MMLRIYVAHALGAGHDREANRTAASKWCAAIADLGYAPIADWIILSGEWDESKREKGLAIDLELIGACHEVWLVGPRVSPGMRAEAAHALACGKVVRDFTGIGVDDLASVIADSHALKAQEIDTVYELAESFL